MEIIFIAIAFLVGSLLVYLILNNRIQKLRLETSAKLSKDEVNTNYVNRDLYNSIVESQSGIKSALDQEKLTTVTLNVDVLRLTGESNSKLTKEEVENSYIARETFNLINGKLTNA
jgi:hypothetical protein